MTKTVFSHLLKKDVILDGEALAFSELFDGKKSYYYRQSTDVSHYVTLADLGYTVADHMSLFSESGGRRAKVYHVARNNIPPVAAAYGYHFLRDDGSSVQPGTWFSEAMAKLDETTIPRIDSLLRAGWSEEHAIIIAVFPDREARLQEAVDNSMHYYDLFLGTSYDLAMIRRLLDVPGVYFLYLKDILDKGFTEAEVKGFGFNATLSYTVEELRGAKIKPSFVKNLLSPFGLREWKPSIEEIEALFAAGLKNGKQYKTIAKLIGVKPDEKKSLDKVTIAAKILSVDDATKILNQVGPISLAEVGQLSLILADGHTVDKYLEIVAAVDAAVEDDFMLGASIATTAREALQKGLTVDEIRDLSRQGVPLAEMKL